MLNSLFAVRSAPRAGAVEQRDATADQSDLAAANQVRSVTSMRFSTTIFFGESGKSLIS